MFLPSAFATGSGRAFVKTLVPRNPWPPTTPGSRFITLAP
jgi:hypothetical protein